MEDKKETQNERKDTFWKEHELTIVPLLICAGVVALIWGFGHTLEKQSLKAYERSVQAKVANAVDSVQQAHDTMALSAAVKQR